MKKTIILVSLFLTPIISNAYQITQSSIAKKEPTNQILVIYTNPFKPGMTKKEIISANKDTLKALQEQRNALMKPILERFKTAKANDWYYSPGHTSYPYYNKYASEQHAKRKYLSARKIVMDSYAKAKSQLEIDYKNEALVYRLRNKKSKS